MTVGIGSNVSVLRAILTNVKRDGQELAAKSLARKAVKWTLITLLVLALLLVLRVLWAKYREYRDDDPARGAMAIESSQLGESYLQPVYVEQGWSEADSLWFYNTTQGSDLIPYDFFLVLEQATNDTLFRDNAHMDGFRYLPQHPTEMNPDGLPVGFVKDEYKGRNYVGFTCAACHTGQVNYQGAALRIDGGPAMADMVGFLEALQASMIQTRDVSEKRDRFIRKVIALNNDFDHAEDVTAQLDYWSNSVELYNIVNHVKKSSDYGYARLDAFGRIYNRVLQHVINSEQAAHILSSVVNGMGKRILTDEQITKVLAGFNKTIMDDAQFYEMIQRLESNDQGYPNLGAKDMLRVRNAFFNEPDAPVSYPFLWDIAQSDYVQWNGLANNAGLGPLGRNAGEVIGVFGTLDWTQYDGGFNLGAYLSGQKNKHTKMKFDSSIDLYNLGRLESRLKSLQSPRWVDAKEALDKSLRGQNVNLKDWAIDWEQADEGRLLYEQYCESCHEVIDRTNWDRLVVAKMSKLESIGTDPKMALNSVSYKGYSGNFVDTLQSVEVGGDVVIEELAPVVQILTSATTGVVATPDVDKNWFDRLADWLYTVINSLSENNVKSSLKAGDYHPDTTANPYASLLSYKARSLNGIWATAPYLHNGSVPTLYDLLLPAKREGDPQGDEYEYRPDNFWIGKREFDPVKVGFVSETGVGFEFNSAFEGNANHGHEYAAGKTPQLNGTVLPALGKTQRLALLEYLKTL